VLEDAPAGIQSGKNAAMRVIGIAFTYGRDDLLASGADVVIDRLSDLSIERTTSALNPVAIFGR
jgi:beta-phosphoglucomutase-like phosphatase (HAD superfamily)